MSPGRYCCLIASARGFDVRVGEKVTYPEWTQASTATIIRTKTMFAWARRPRRRRSQFRPVPRRKAKENPSRDKRKAPRDCGVRSSKWPKESLYSSGFLVSSSEISMPEVGGFEYATKNIPTENTRMPKAKRTVEEITPARRS